MVNLLKPFLILLLATVLIACGDDLQSNSNSSSGGDPDTTPSDPDDPAPLPTPTTVASVSSFEIVEVDEDTNTLISVMPIEDGADIDLNDLPTQFNVITEVSDSSTAGSVDFLTQGQGCASIDRHENDEPFTVENQNTGISLSEGGCIITATPYSEDDLGGEKGESVSISFDVIDTSAPVVDIPAITGFELIDDSDNTIQTLIDGGNVDLNSLPSLFNIVAVSEDAAGTGSVGVSISGCVTVAAVTNSAPFIAQSSDFSSLPLGECTITATPYENNDLGGQAGDTISLSVNIIDTTPVMLTLDHFELVDRAVGNFQTLTNGSTVDLNGLPSPFNFAAIASNSSDSASVAFSMSGCTSLNRYENTAPYTAAIETNGFNSLTLGECTLTATPYESADLSGDAGTPISITFNVVDTSPVNEDGVFPVIKASRTSCASPCTVVFSAEDTTANGMDETAVWRELSYHWDFDTDETDTYGGLYDQTYDLVPGDTAREVGHVPMVTKTFLCESGTCIYNVGLRAQTDTGDYGDTYQLIAVQSESSAWSSSNTVCISNTLDTSSNWTSYDKPCPNGAEKRNSTLDWDDYEGKLVLFKKGDVFEQTYLATNLSESNFKLGYFGNDGDLKPEILAHVRLGITSIVGSANSPIGANYSGINNTTIDNADGFPENITIEGLRIARIQLPMSYSHIGLHDLDMNYENSSDNDHGHISITFMPTICHYPSMYPNLDCENVPFPKGGYFSDIDIHGGGSTGPGISFGETQCPLVNYLGITEVNIQKSYEHHIRIAGWYRINIMRSAFRGEHYLNSKQKITTRACLRSGSTWEGGGSWSYSEVADTWDDDIEGRTRADTFTTDPDEQFFHQSRYQVIAYNQIGDNDSELGDFLGGTPYQTNARESYRVLIKDVMISHNIFEREPGIAANGDVQLWAIDSACIDNNYWNAGYASASGCVPNGSDADELNNVIEPAVTPFPSAPGS